MDQMPNATLPPASISRRRFTVAEYYRMAEVGILSPSDRVELIEKTILDMPPIGNRHVSTVMALTQEFSEVLRRLVVVSVQNPIWLPNESEPEPDIAILKPRPDRYATGKPGPDDVLLLVEVADSSLDYDRGEKRDLYARGGIGEYWAVNLLADEVEVCRGPTAGGYASIVPVGLHGTLGIAAFPGSSIAVRDIVPPR